MALVDLSKPGERKKLIFAGVLGLGAILVILIRLGWRVASANFDRERLITGTK